MLGEKKEKRSKVNEGSVEKNERKHGGKKDTKVKVERRDLWQPKEISRVGKG